MLKKIHVNSDSSGTCGNSQNAYLFRIDRWKFGDKKEKKWKVFERVCSRLYFYTETLIDTNKQIQTQIHIYIYIYTLLYNYVKNILKYVKVSKEQERIKKYFLGGPKENILKYNNSKRMLCINSIQVFQSQRLAICIANEECHRKNI